MEKIRVLIVDDSNQTRENVSILLSFENKIQVIGEATNGEEAIILTKELKPDIVLMDINMPIVDGIKSTEKISLEVPGSSVIIMSVQGDKEYLKKAMLAGARGFLIKPFSTEDLLKTIYETFDLESKRRENPALPKIIEKVESKIFTVFSTKGGVGKTTIASNLAVGIARLSKKKVILIDLDLQFGDVAIILNVSIKNTISDLINEVSHIDEYSIEEYLSTHFSGLKVLPAPIKPEYAEYITSVHIEKILNILKKNYSYIVIDTSASFHETVLTSLDMSDKIFFVATLDLPTIKNVKSGFDVMDTLHYPKEKINIILNKASEQFGIKYKDFEDTLKHPIWNYIPEDSGTVVTSANKGLPFVMSRTDTKVAKAVLDISAEIIDSKNDPKENEKFSIKKLFGI